MRDDAYPDAMHCRVLLFAGLAEIAGVREIELDLPDGATVDAALNAVAAAHAAIAAQLNVAAVALDESYASRDAPLTDGCTLAIIPPVSGG